MKVTQNAGNGISENSDSKFPGGTCPRNPSNKIHIHGQFFVPLSVTEVPLQPCEKKTSFL